MERELVDDEGYQVHLSLPTEDDYAAWLIPGLRVELGLNHGFLSGLAPAPRLSLTAFQLRTRLRVDPFWSVGATFGYAIATGSYTGTRWHVSIEPVFHPIPSLGLSLGLGYGGLDVTENASGGEPPAGAAAETASRTLGKSERMFACAGGAVVSQARLEYLMVVGPLFSTGPFVQADLQWTGCQEDFNQVDRETGKQVRGSQWWLHRGGALGWWFSWR